MKRFFLLLILCIQYSLFAQTFPSNFSRDLVDDGLAYPTAFTFVPDGRIFVTEQGGSLRVIKNGSLLSTPAITITTNASGERGLLGVAVDPDFATNNYVYLYYTVPAGAERTAPFNKIVRYTFDGDVITPSSVQTILELDDLSATNHNGGALDFGPDGKLYIAVGENAVGSNAQNLDNYLGKILRVNPDGSVPDGNPFSGNAARARIWAYGLRNPYTFTFDRITGTLYVNDVGQDDWEEINDATEPGLNFGWPSEEGNCTSGCTGYTDPVFAYGHDGDHNETGCSIVGGTFFNPVSTTYPLEYRGKYFFSEYCNDWINYIDPLNPVAQTSFATSVGDKQTYLLTGPDGNLYYLSRQDGALYRIKYNSGGAPPEITNQPDSITVTEGSEAEFEVSVSGNEPISYQWFKNNGIISGADEDEFTIASTVPADEGLYRVLVSNSFGSVLSDPALLTVEDVTVTLDAQNGQPYKISPNPGTGKFNVQFRYSVSPESKNVVVKTLRGEELVNIPKLGDNLDLTNLAPGMYVVLIDGYPTKVVKE